MPSEFCQINERVVLHKYTEPLQDSDFDVIADQFAAYAEQASRPFYLILDYQEIEHVPANLLSVGLRQGMHNPLRHPKLEHIVVITHSRLVMSVASTVAMIMGIEKYSVVGSREQADREIERFLEFS